MLIKIKPRVAALLIRAAVMLICLFVGGDQFQAYTRPALPPVSPIPAEFNSEFT